MEQGIQSILLAAGEEACYTLCLGNVAEEYLHQEMNACDVLGAAIGEKFVHYNPDNPDDNNNFFVDYPAGLLGALTGKVWDVRKESAEYVPVPGDFIIERWERIKTGAVIAHFKRPDWNSLVYSATVEFGHLASVRVCRVIQ
jgi:hypothetical protein